MVRRMQRFEVDVLACFLYFACGASAAVVHTLAVPPSGCDAASYSITADHAHVALTVTGIEAQGGNCSNANISCALP